MFSFLKYMKIVAQIAMKNNYTPVVIKTVQPFFSVYTNLAVYTMYSL